MQTDRQTEKTRGGGRETHCISGVETKIFPALSVPRKCPLIILVAVTYEQLDRNSVMCGDEKLSEGFAAYDQN
jgi:hypothetical protein